MPKVGPGNPPVETRFKKGTSGNPAGRPPKDRSLVNLVQDELDAVMTLTERGKKRKLSKREVLAKRMVNDALQGDKRAIASLLKFLPNETAERGPAQAEVPLETVLSFLRRQSGNEGGGR